MPRSENEAQMIRDLLDDEKTGGVVDGPEPGRCLACGRRHKKIYRMRLGAAMAKFVGADFIDYLTPIMDIVERLAGRQTEGTRTPRLMRRRP